MEQFLDKKTDKKIPVIIMRTYLKRLKFYYLQGGNMFLEQLKSQDKDMKLAERDFKALDPPFSHPEVLEMF
jgi:hypothetical protein